MQQLLGQWREQWPKYVALVLLAIWGGTASHISRMKRYGLPFSLPEMLGEWVICGFSGVMALFLCQEYGMSFALTGVITGFAGHMGGRFIYLLNNRITSLLPPFKGPTDEK